MSKILTFPCGVMIDIRDPKPEDIRVEDIAWSLANEGRYANFTPERISVAQHSWYVSWLLRHNDHQSAVGLFHDGSEAYLRDIPSPVKHLFEMDGYRKLEHQMQLAVNFAMIAPGWDKIPAGVIEKADKDSLFWEDVKTQRNRMTLDMTVTWPRVMDTVWAPQVAFGKFMERYGELKAMGACI